MFSDEVEEERTMPKWVVVVRDTMRMFAAEAESRGLVGLAFKD